MTLTPLLNASPAVQIHVATALLALVTGVIQLYRMKRGTAHKMLGYVWVTLMMTTALASMFIHSIRSFGLFSPIHLLSIYVFGSMIASVLLARAGKYSIHRRLMLGAFWFGIIGAGAFTFLPGRIMYRVVTGG